MPWREVSVMDQRREFVRLANQEGANRRELCRRFGISPEVGYKWLGRFAANGELGDRSRRPHTVPLRTDRAIEDRILALRDGHPAWGARKIARCLEREGQAVPAVSTVHEILRRHGRVVAPQRAPGAYRRFEKEAPNQLWQMDFKGWVRLAYEGQGEPFILEAGDCVLQPPEIRHRVLESSAGAEVIELGSPAEHITMADHDMTLPNGNGALAIARLIK